ncbi:hypothetical protein [Myroides odoratus]|uniref:Uncharacterized protein n=1 Tax=Myroides odoratus TaxID=256 RepID=A0A9Q6Z496_MYROD|nr:hypothetical protein [Myroides odoratus]EHQ42225.1 hypothetical protein Myrod_1392 [Myroides odoratus DSM 2801]EKB09281.1 hypothetical protein HMPREF9716_00101 [Myroides odoratus CIP 103059]QQT99605.1 hypothetical protein I6I88_15690 [Myroides odoratus]WQD58188.1 hypothetical protein U0010_03265 [Myroides odoratus]STZ29485.1 Uncharacterised protein [Myroides odoratus]
MRLVLTFLLLIVGVSVWAQNRVPLQGKIVSRSKDLKGIYVSNINTGDALVTEPGGYFSIQAQEKDTLMFSGPLFIGYRYVLDDIDFKRDIVLIPLEPNDLNRQLNEIVITHISSSSLGLVPEGARRYTPAERRLYTATSGSGIIPVSAIVNWISGRTAMLKKALKYEKQEMRKDKFLNVMDEYVLIKDYSIPKDYVVGFAYYVSDDDIMSGYLNAGITEKDKISSRTGVLALEFLDLLGDKIKEEPQQKNLTIEQVNLNEQKATKK